MGAYLSEPSTTKDSSDEANALVICGSSSMQGWRISQEDAHNCIMSYDDNSSFFAVYDGHGGAEVAQYCSQHLPNFLKTVDAYKRKDFEQALKAAFLGFDATLLQDKVIEELKLLSDKSNGEDEADEDEEEEEDDNVEDLCKEAVMPLNEVLQKYRKDVKQPPVANQRVAMVAKEGNCSKPISPYLKSKRRGATDGSGCSGTSKDGVNKPSPTKVDGGSSSSDAEADPAAENSIPAGSSKDAADSTVSSSSNKTVERAKESTPQPEPSSSSSSSAASGAAAPVKAEVAAAGSSGIKTAEQSNEISDTAGNVAVKSEGEAAAGSTGGKENCAPDSSSSDGSKQSAASGGKVNGNVAKAASSGAVSSSCSSSGSGGQENGVAGTGSCDSGSGSAGGSKGTSSSSSSPAKVHSSSTAGKAAPKNGPSAPDASMMELDDTDDDDDDDESDSDEEFPHAEEPTDDTSSTGEGEEDTDGDEGHDSDEEEEEVDEDEDYMHLKEYITEEDAAFMKTITDEPGKDSGCTAVVALLNGKDLYVANAGDSRCVVCRNGKALDMSFDHKPEDTIEYERIEKAGGRVTLDGRVNGGLNLSRAIGDHGYKMNKSLPAEEQMISALPDIEKITIGPEDEFMVLACDGIWNYLNSEEVVQFVQKRINKPDTKLSKICEELFDYCLAPHTRGDGTGCDNMTAIIVQFTPKLTGAASRKRAASHSVDGVANACDTDAVSSATKKVKTDAATVDDASSTTDGSGNSNGKEADATEETEATAAVASIADGSCSSVDAATTAEGGSSEAASSST
ncbi:probable protein phosphatase CG10417 [Anopheles nili]|uniref:probable protein phosphatase CG10417 n=1 Tax=Anopheles nili TaxID=185578 RepID=UPI00237C3802|nr:probable protein phosphatase CG10417 [Anopheles nili]